jgi:uncharacterized repeat protein (TIGR03809 family)
MSAGSTTPRLEAATARWRALALQRHAYYLDLFKSGRWTHYFTEQEFIERMRDVMRATASWSQLAGAAAPHEPAAPAPYRSAA